MLTGYAGVPLSVRAARWLHLKQRQRGFDETACVESCMGWNALGGDGLNDFDPLCEDAGLRQMLGHEIPSPSRSGRITGSWLDVGPFTDALCYLLLEMNRRIAYRLVALLLLLAMGGDVVACEFSSHDHFESFRMPGNDMRTHQSHDHCICCCTHAVAAAAVAIPEPANLVETVILTELEPAMRTPAAVYHPPKA